MSKNKFYKREASYARELKKLGDQNRQFQSCNTSCDTNKNTKCPRRLQQISLQRWNQILGLHISRIAKNEVKQVDGLARVYATSVNIHSEPIRKEHEWAARVGTSTYIVNAHVGRIIWERFLAS